MVLMRKLSLIALGLLFAPMAQAMNDCQDFSSKLSRCSTYTCSASIDLTGPGVSVQSSGNMPTGGAMMPGMPPMPGLGLPLPMPQRLDFKYRVIGWVGDACHYKEDRMVDGVKLEELECFLNPLQLETFALAGSPPQLPDSIARTCETIGFDGQMEQGARGNVPGGAYINSDPVVIERQENSQYEWYE